ncbi:MAG: hypothetical protein WA133_13135 [Syntrophales bacterium]
MKILDMKCAEYGAELAAEDHDDTLITKALGVLQEDGVYAFFLYLSAKKSEEASKLQIKAFKFLKQPEILGHLFSTDTDPLPALRERFRDNLDELLFSKELLERTLVYARYHAKASGKQKTADSEGDGE